MNAELKDTPNEILDKAYEIYQDKGQQGVFDYVNSLSEEDKKLITWKRCNPCDCESPFTTGICVVCWSAEGSL